MTPVMTSARRLVGRTGRALLRRPGARRGLLWAHARLRGIDRVGPSETATWTPRRRDHACPGCDSSRVRTLSEISYLSTHLDRWGSDLATFVEIVPPEHWFLSFRLDFCDDCQLQFVPHTPRGLVEQVESHPLFVEKTVQPWLEQTQVLMSEQRAARLRSDAPDFDALEHLHASMFRVVSDTLRAKERFLDVGCNAGGFSELVRLSRPDVVVEGCELNGTYVKLARERYPALPVRSTPLLPGAPSSTWDVIHVADVIEHIWDLDSFVQALGDHLSPGGRLVIVTPNVDSTAARTQGFRWWSYLVPHHAQVFGRSSLDALFRRFGFQRTAGGEIGEEVWTVYERFLATA